MLGYGKLASELLVSGAPKGYVTLWQTIAVAVWTVGTGALARLGIGIVSHLRYLARWRMG